MRLIGLAVILAVSITLAPLAAQAQQAEKVARIAYLSSLSAAASQGVVEAFTQGLREFGYLEGRNILIEYRWADGHYERLPGLAKEVVGMNVDVIVSVGGTPTARAVKAATKSIPSSSSSEILWPVGSWRASRAPVETSRASTSSQPNSTLNASKS